MVELAAARGLFAGQRLDRQRMDLAAHELAERSIDELVARDGCACPRTRGDDDARGEMRVVVGFDAHLGAGQRRRESVRRLAAGFMAGAMRAMARAGRSYITLLADAWSCRLLIRGMQSLPPDTPARRPPAAGARRGARWRSRRTPSRRSQPRLDAALRRRLPRLPGLRRPRRRHRHGQVGPHRRQDRRHAGEHRHAGVLPAPGRGQPRRPRHDHARGRAAGASRTRARRPSSCCCCRT